MLRRTRTPDPRFVRHAAAALAAVLALGPGAATAAAPSRGVIAQKPGRAGCISDGGTGGSCARGRALRRATAIALSADGRSAYVASPIEGLAVLDRDPGGGLTQKAGPAGCVSDLDAGCVESLSAAAEYAVAVSPDDKNVYSGGLNGLSVFDRDPASGAIRQQAGPAGCFHPEAQTCTRLATLDWPDAVAISPDGLNVYAGSLLNEVMTIFDRDATGALQPKAGRDGCLSDDGSGGRCTRAGFDGVWSLAVSPDGRNVYVGTLDGLMIYDRLPGGTLRRKPGRAGCLTDGGLGGTCARGKELGGATSVVISADGRSLYAVAGAVAIVDRDVTTGALKQKRGRAGCISDSGSDGCTNAKALRETEGIAISPDGLSVYVTGRDGVATFDRNATTGTLRQKRKLAGCVSDDGSRGICANGKALLRPEGIKVSADGSSVYATADASSAVAVFDRR